MSFDEFCGLMSKMLGPDGRLDLEGSLKNMSEAATREARQNQIVDLVPIMEENIKKNQDTIEQEQTKLNITSQRVQCLEADYADLLNELRKLHKGLDLSQEYWKGFSKGLKETKKTVHHEGDGEMLP